MVVFFYYLVNTVHNILLSDRFVIEIMTCVFADRDLPVLHYVVSNEYYFDPNKNSLTLCAITRVHHIRLNNKGSH